MAEQIVAPSHVAPKKPAQPEAGDLSMSREEYAELIFEIDNQPLRWRSIADKECDYADGNQLDSELLKAQQALGIPPAMIAALMAPIDTPATQSGATPAAAAQAKYVLVCAEQRAGSVAVVLFGRGVEPEDALLLFVGHAAFLPRWLSTRSRISFVHTSSPYSVSPGTLNSLQNRSVPMP